LTNYCNTQETEEPSPFIAERESGVRRLSPLVR